MTALGALLLLLAAAPTDAPPATAAPSTPQAAPAAAASPKIGGLSAEVTVVGRRHLTPDGQVDAVGAVNPSTGQMARWTRAPCVVVLGAPAEVDAYVTETIGAAAHGLRLPTARGRCSADVLVAFTTAPVAAWAKLMAEGPLFDDYDRVVPLPTRLDAPVTWLRSEHEAPSDGSNWLGNLGSRGQLHAKDTRIGTSVRTDAVRLIVVVDAQQVAGLKVSAVAAYLTMVVLAPVRPDRPSLDAASALNLFRHVAADGPPVAELTRWDHAYLEGLYSAMPGGLARDQQQRIRETLTHAALR